MPERSNGEVGFTSQDREVLITLKVEMKRLQDDLRDIRAEARDGLQRVTRLESDRVGRKDLEDLLSVIEEKSEENSKVSRQITEHGVRLAEVEKLKPEVDAVKKYMWMGMGGLAVLQVVLTVLLVLFKK